MILTLLLGLAVQNPQVTVVGEKPVKERKVCKQIAGATGSRLGGGRECHTASEWKAMQTEVSERALNDLNNVKGYGSGPDQKMMRPGGASR